ncbi:MAG: aerotolerance regulator BatC [Flavobacteriaceae bacterium]|jgi:tetratricopeptide (TPR) repeat protein|nr:aerotolerance regulator BatC [Flavobacteriaceae bacterium]MBT4113379.1 aerotolerance regulator BatC [Flavobacteriaceae bacterium]MBT5246662.1 aerotolerance regulator BatC [Flavobacteriaceae bacterium]MBT5772690.1 aerotolerance regulator BatC [Flavobacteriaceae bacterium]
MVFHKHIHIIIIFFFSINLFGQDESYNKHLYDGNINYDKDFLLAENSYRKAISINSSNIKAPYNLSNKYYEEELYDEALIRQVEALKNAKSNNEKHRINHNIGNILMKKDLCKEALEAYKNALRNNPDDDETRYNLSLAKLCADEQNKNNDKKDDKKDDQQKDDKKDDQQKDDKKDDQQKDDKKDDQQKDDKQDQKNDNKNEQKDKKNNPSKDRGSAKLSPEQIKNLLKAMNNEENKVQAKINEKKQKGVKIVTEKDW